MKLILPIAALLLMAPGVDSPKWRAENAARFALDSARESGGVAHKFAESEHVTINVLTPSADIAAHYHARHDETVYIVRGRGTMRIGTRGGGEGGEEGGPHSPHLETVTVREGDLIFLPKGTIHSFSPEGDDVIAISIFSPKFDGVDRVFVDR